VTPVTVEAEPVIEMPPRIILPAMEDCVFCGIVAHRLPSWTVEEAAGAVAFLTIQPFAEGHTLVVPRTHAETLDDVADGERTALWDLVHRVARRMRAAGLADGVNLFVASGPAAEQSVRHLHVHLVPRRVGDQFDLNSWFDSKVRSVPDARQRELARRLGPPERG